jgi:glycosylphosphatidylinositol transamidase (GPIT) subunit GPI8
METRDSSLRNNFVGKIVRNVDRANKYSGNTRNITYNSSGIEKCA